MIRRPPRSTRTDTLFPYTTLFRSLTEQIGLLIENHNVPVEIGVSDEPIPVHFAYAHDINVETVSLRASMTDGGPPMRDLFDVPDLAAMDDTIVNGTYAPPPVAPLPLPMFQAPPVGYSLLRLPPQNPPP